MHAWLDRTVLVPDVQVLGRYCMNGLPILSWTTYLFCMLYFLVTENESRQAEPVPANGLSAEEKV